MVVHVPIALVQNAGVFYATIEAVVRGTPYFGEQKGQQLIQLFRYFRLQKECAPSTTRKRRRRNYYSDTARLEQKVDGLVSILKASNGSFAPFDIHSSSPLPSPATPVAAGGLENSSSDEHYQTSTINNYHQRHRQQFQNQGPLTPGSTSSSSLFPYFRIPFLMALSRLPKRQSNTFISSAQNTLASSPLYIWDKR